MIIREFAEKWFKNKHLLEKYFLSLNIENTWLEYIDIVKALVKFVLNDNEDKYDNYNIDKITVVDDGDYQGTQLFIVPRNTYQPNFDDYIITHNMYGSCSGCDTLLSIIDYRSKTLDKDQVRKLMDLSLHLLQRFQKLRDYVENGFNNGQI